MEDSRGSLYKLRMGRRKLDAQRVGVRLPTQTLTAISDLLRDREDRSDFLREAAELLILIRNLDVYPLLLGYLTANESFADFCARAVRQAAMRRITILTEAEEADDAAGPDQPAKTVSEQATTPRPRNKPPTK